MIGKLTNISIKNRYKISKAKYTAIDIKINVSLIVLHFVLYKLYYDTIWLLLNVTHKKFDNAAIVEFYTLAVYIYKYS